jgi:hypothetical protein
MGMDLGWVRFACEGLLHRTVYSRLGRSGGLVPPAISTVGRGGAARGRVSRCMALRAVGSHRALPCRAGERNAAFSRCMALRRVGSRRSGRWNATFPRCETLRSVTSYRALSCGTGLADASRVGARSCRSHVARHRVRRVRIGGGHVGCTALTLYGIAFGRRASGAIGPGRWSRNARRWMARACWAGPHPGGGVPMMCGIGFGKRRIGFGPGPRDRLTLQGIASGAGRFRVPDPNRRRSVHAWRHDRNWPAACAAWSRCGGEAVGMTGQQNRVWPDHRMGAAPRLDRDIVRPIAGCGEVGVTPPRGKLAAP